jgi:peptidoglycan/xylan/chitin deacetylase (PgdA/CDA1 family)
LLGGSKIVHTIVQTIGALVKAARPPNLYVLALCVLVAASIAALLLVYVPKTVPVPVLVYHNVIEADAPVAVGEVYVRRAIFEEELGYLAHHGYTPVTFAEAAGALPPGSRPVVIAFDDGFENQYRTALPILEQYGFKATFFINSGRIGESGFMDWGQIRALSDAGMEIAGHTSTHPHLYGLSDAALENEIADDKQSIEAHLGRPIMTFAYPYGEPDSRARAMLMQSGYSSARLSSPTAPTGDVYRIPAHVLTDTLNSFLGAL